MKTSLTKPNPISIYFFLFLLTFFLRLPYFFDSVIGWDESTYTLMGQDLLNGHLPYTHLWEVKPPLVFLFYALFINLFGKSILAIRLGGVLVVFCAAFFVYKTGRNLYNRKAGFYGAVLLIIYATVFKDAQITLTEHLTLIPISLILFLLTQKNTPRNIFLLGLLLGIITLTRTNLGYLFPAVGIILALDTIKKGIFKTTINVLLLSSGFLVLPLVIGALYLSKGYLDLLIRSTVMAPLAYSTVYSQNFFYKTRGVASLIYTSVFSENFLIWILFLGGILTSHFYPVRQKRIPIFKILTLFSFALLSIIHSGRTYPHYLIQLLPFMALVAGFFLISLLATKIKILFLILALVFSLKPVVLKYTKVAKNVYQEQAFLTDTGYKVINYLNQQRVSGEYVFFTVYHIGYWLTDTKIPTYYAHPSNLAKEFILKTVEGEEASTESELKEIFSKKPVFIIKPEKIWYFDEFSPVGNQLLDEAIKEDYSLTEKIDDIFIYKRR